MMYPWIVWSLVLPSLAYIGLVAEKGHPPWARALAAAKCSIHPVHCNSLPYEFPNQINDKCNTNKYVNVVEYL